MWDFICEYILPILLLILIILAIMLIIGVTIIFYKTNILNQNNSMQNLEEKLNIYESKYDEFCLEDSKKQSDIYE